ncbi:Fz domain protein [Aphelenchoides besseyi]|nr:Fz domain protein [Aphelenchoides besseyi]KAI6211971.1 Fz domain protein [Aphelenchoides besseyi]
MSPLLFLFIGFYFVNGMYIGQNWDVLSTERTEQPKCVQIPRNFSLCYGIQYETMRLPNLLEHETLEEVIQQSDAWLSLIRLHCHPDTKLFLCSVFAPVCLPNMDKPIQPCQSLCQAVQQGCENRMQAYGFSWPDILDCKRFPADNDMCIKKPEVGEMREEQTGGSSSGSHSRMFPFSSVTSQRSTDVNGLKIESTTPLLTTSTPLTTQQAFNNVIAPSVASTVSTANLTTESSETKRACRSCVQVPTYENILDHFCRSNIVFKAKVRAMNASHLIVQRIQRVFKPTSSSRKSPKSIAQTIQITDSTHGENDCQCPMSSGNKRQSNNVLVMSNDSRTGGVINARLVLQWQQHDKTFKSAIRKFRKVDCGMLGREIRESALKKNMKLQTRP